MTTYLYGLGFEAGHIAMLPTSDVVGDFTVSTTSKHTGAYSMRIDDRGASAIGHAHVVVSGSPTELYFGIWIDPDTAYQDSSIIAVGVRLSDGKYVELRMDAGGAYDAYSDGNLIDSGAIVVANDWHHLQARVSIANSGGIVQTRVDGISDMAFTGDTQPGAVADITHFSMRHLVGAKIYYVDDIVLASGGWPGDIRFDALFPNADTATEEWDRSAGADSYALIDEVPPSDADYIYTGVDAEDTIVALADWTGTGKTPMFATLWVRAWKDEAAGHQVAIIDSDGANTNVGSFQDLLTSATHLKKLLTTAPDGGAWSDTDADSLQVGVRSNIV